MTGFDLHNQGQYFAAKIPLPFYPRLRLFAWGGMAQLGGLSLKVERFVLWDRAQDPLLLVVGVRLGWVQQVSKSQWMFDEPTTGELQGGLYRQLWTVHALGDRAGRGVEVSYRLSAFEPGGRKLFCT